MSRADNLTTFMCLYYLEPKFLLSPVMGWLNFRVTCYFYCNICPTRCNVTQFILSGNSYTCFGWYHHPTSGRQTTVSTASGICHTVKEQRNILHEIRKRKANWIGHILRRNCLLQRVIEKDKRRDRSDRKTRKKT